MRARVPLIVLAGALLASCGKNDKPGGGPTMDPPVPASGNAPGLNASKDLSGDLEKLARRTIDAARNDPAKLKELVASFVTPDPDAWCKATFGDDGAAMAKKMKDMAPHFDEEVRPLFEKLVADGRTNIEVLRIVKADDRNATGAQKNTVAMMKTPCALYTVNFSRAADDLGMSTWNWVYIDGGFRMVGNLR